MKGNRQGFLSRLITRRSGQNCKIILHFYILQFCLQLVKKVQRDFFDKLTAAFWLRFLYHLNAQAFNAATKAAGSAALK